MNIGVYILQNQTSDFVAVMTFIASLIFSAEVAAIVGPYVTIAAAASVGASFALAKRKVGSRAEGRLFFLRTVALALMFTVVLSRIVQAYYPVLTERISLIPIAMLLGFGGDEMPKLLAKLWKKLVGAIDFMWKGQV